MNPGDIALSSPDCLEPRHAPDGEKLRPHAALFQFAEQVIEPDAVTPDHHEVGKLQLAVEQRHGHDRSGRNDFLVTADGGEAVGSAERGNAPGALTHWIRDKRRCGPAEAGHYGCRVVVSGY